MNTTDYVAIYGATVATMVLIWDGIKWYATGPKLRASARCHVAYPDSRVLKTERTESGEVRHLAEYCHIEVVNVGDRPTTIMSIEGTHERKTGAMRVVSGGVLFTSHNGKQLPLTLGPGEMWSSRIEMPAVYSLAAHGKPVIHIRASHKKDPVRVCPKFRREDYDLA
jgi:hypothetical protein